MTHGALFAGLNVLGLAFKQLGVETLWCSETDSFCRELLNKNFPKTRQYGDIRAIENLPYVDIISGGFPCQDISGAGPGHGIRGARSSLWFAMSNVVSKARPKYIIIENSPMLVKRGLEHVLFDLAEIGYDAEWRCLRASDFGYPHKRERLFLVAYPDSFRCLAQAHKARVFSQEIPETTKRELVRAVSGEIRNKANSEILRDDDGTPFVLDRIKALGNAIVYDVALYVARSVLSFHSVLHSNLPQ